MKVKKIIRVPRMMLSAIVLEGLETKQMLHIFARHGRAKLVKSYSKKPSAEEMAQAYEQLRDIPRFLPFFVLIVAPLPGVTEGYVLLSVTLESWMGHKVRLLPSQFRKVFQKQPQG